MAITPPTPPTPPTAPVVPGARDTSASEAQMDAGAVQEADNTQPKEFGVNISITRPDESQATQSNSNSPVNGEVQSPQTQKEPAAKPEPDSATQQTQADAQNAQIQAAVSVQAETEQNEEVQMPFPLANNNMSSLSYLPLVLVFIAAFITFTIRNLSKNKKNTMPMPAKIVKAKPESVRTVHTAAKTNEDKDKGKHFELRI